MGAEEIRDPISRKDALDYILAGRNNERLLSVTTRSIDGQELRTLNEGEYWSKSEMKERFSGMGKRAIGFQFSNVGGISFPHDKKAFPRPSGLHTIALAEVDKEKGERYHMLALIPKAIVGKRRFGVENAQILEFEDGRLIFTQVLGYYQSKGNSGLRAIQYSFSTKSMFDYKAVLTLEQAELIEIPRDDFFLKNHDDLRKGLNNAGSLYKKPLISRNYRDAVPAHFLPKMQGGINNLELIFSEGFSTPIGPEWENVREKIELRLSIPRKIEIRTITHMYTLLGGEDVLPYAHIGGNIVRQMQSIIPQLPLIFKELTPGDLRKERILVWMKNTRERISKAITS